jgi:peptidoglycan/xylan/chitin deacetylase (PgdA/CDA1 family)
MTLRDFIAPLWGTGRRLAGRGRAPAGAFRILMFHGIPHECIDDFAHLMDRLAAGPGIIDPEEAARRIDGKDRAGRAAARPPVLISFDDGFASNGHVAREILAPRGIRALFFVCPALIDLAGAAQEEAVLRQVFRGHRPAREIEPMLDWDAVGGLVTDGHMIGAHGMNHVRLAGLSAEALEEEVVGAQAALRARLGTAPDWFAYPFGDIGAIDAAALAAIAARYRFCRSGVRGANMSGGHPLALRADNVDLDTSPAWQYLAADGALDFRYGAARAQLDALAYAARPNGPA